MIESEKTYTHKDIYKAIIKSQHCQRNWDLTKEMPEEDVKLIMNAATQCPSKQNMAFYKLHFITNRELIEEIHNHTWTQWTSREGFSETNPQTLANLLIVFELENLEDQIKKDTIIRNRETKNILEGNDDKERSLNTLRKDAMVAIGIAAGYLNLTASLLNYRTGCCQCFDVTKVQKLMCLKNEPFLLMGIGHHKEGINRKIHHIRNEIVISAKKKQPIEVVIW